MPTAVDLFAGAGGFSLGASQAGYDVTHAVEIDSWAASTLARNHAGTRVTEADITELSDDWIRRELPVEPDLLIGGPPCQGFSHAAVGRHDPKDPRNSLFRDFVRVARILQPRRLVIENVPGLLRSRTSSGEPVAEVIVSELEQLGFTVNVFTLNAEQFGVPQIRRRVFFVGSTDGSVADVIPPTFDGVHRPFRTVRDAIADLPDAQVGIARDPAEYDRPAVSDYQFALRSASGTVRNHVPMRHTQRMIERFKSIAPGQSQTHVSEEHAPRRRVRAPGSSSRYDQNNRRMHWDRPCHTIPATFYANFIHPEAHRNFTPREGARIQSFPDDYVFEGKPTTVSQKLLAREGREGERHLSQYNQIGNAVPPLLAQALIEHVAPVSRATAEVAAHG